MVQVFRAVMLVLCLGAAVSAQAAKRTGKGTVKDSAPAKQVLVDPSQPYALDSIKVIGNRQLSADEILRISGLQAGQRVTRTNFDAAQKLLLDSGLFETVAYRYNPVPGSRSYTATLEVKEIAQLFAYRFEAIDFPEADMRAWLKKQEPLFGDRIPATPPVLKRFSTAVEEFIQDRGKPLPVTAKLLPGDKGELEVVFIPSSLPSVAQVTFTGNHVLSTLALQQGISGAGVGAVYTENRFRQILDASIRPLYEQQGYLRVSFPKLETKPASDVRGVAVTVHVLEGHPYKLRSVQVLGEEGENPRLTKEGKFRTDEIADMKAVEEGAKRVERVLKRRGYMNAASTIERKVDDKARVVDVVIKLDPGPQYHMGKLDILGLDITTEPQIRKLWSLKAKAPFDFEYPDMFIAEMPEVLENLGRTKSTLKPDPGTLTVDVLLTFQPPDKTPGGRKRQDNTRPSHQSVDFP